MPLAIQDVKKGEKRGKAQPGLHIATPAEKPFVSGGAAGGIMPTLLFQVARQSRRWRAVVAVPGFPPSAPPPPVEWQ